LSLSAATTQIALHQKAATSHFNKVLAMHIARSAESGKRLTDADLKGNRMKQANHPFHQIVMTQSQLSLAKDRMDRMKPEEIQALLKEAHTAIETLMDFRNIINAMVSLKEDPRTAARPYVDD
jgi:hypothetical protein